MRRLLLDTFLRKFSKLSYNCLQTVYAVFLGFDLSEMSTQTAIFSQIHVGVPTRFMLCFFGANNYTV